MRTIERRIGLLFAGFLLCFLVVVGRAVWLQGVQGAQLASEATYQQTEVVTVPGLRGSLLDRYGNALAVSEDAATIYATPYQVKNPVKAAEELARILKMDKDEVLESLTEESGFAYIDKQVDLPTAARVERLELPGIGQLPASRRTYPQGEMAGADDRLRRLRKRGADRARARRGTAPCGAATANAARQRRAGRTDPARHGQGSRGRRETSS